MRNPGHTHLRRLGGTALAVLVVLLLTAGAASAAAPTAITGSVTAITPTSATAGGTVNPGGQATTWHFEYGTSTSYGSTTATVSAGSGTANASVSRTISGLAAGTTYHYRLVATNAAGTSQGADGIFTTTAAPGAVTGGTTGITSTSATLEGSVDPNSSPTTWFFDYGTSTSYGSKTAAKSAGAGATPVSVSAPVSGLTRGKVYHYRLVATSDAGTTRGADRTFSTQSAPTVVTRSASNITPTTAKLNGTITPNGLATSWYVEYGTNTAYGTRLTAKNAGSGTSAVSVSASATGLRAATVYHFRFVASNSLGTTVGADQSFNTSVAPAVSTGAAQGIGVATATLTGSVDPKGRATTWWFEYGTTTGYGSKTTTRNAGSGAARGVAEPLSKLSSGTTFHYRLVAKNDVGTTRGSDATFTTIGVTLAPTTLEVVFGRGLRLVGRVPTRLPGEQVTLYAQRIGEPSYRSIATFLTGTDGVWAYQAKPRIGTSYKASWNGGMSPPTAIGVRPAISFRALANRRFTTRVVAAHKFGFRIVQLQRRTLNGRWVTVKRVHLNRNSAVTFRYTLPKGRSVLRIAMSVNQAGLGYLAGISRTIVYHR